MNKKINLTIENEQILLYTVMSKSGLPCLWESGICYNDRLGHSLIVTDEKFKKITSISIKDDLTKQEEHALIPVCEGFFIFTGIFHKPEGYTTYIYKISDISSSLIQAGLVGCSILATNISGFLSKNYKNKDFISAYNIVSYKAEGKKILYCYPPKNKKKGKIIVS